MFRTGIALLAVVAVGAFPADGKRPKNSGEVLKITTTAGAIKDDKQTITITIDIDKPYHLYANPVGNEEQAANATVVEITGKEKPQSVKVAYPAGTVGKIGTETLMIYKDKVVITAEVVRAKGDTEPLKATIKVNACTDSTCLPTAEVVVEIK